MSESRNFMNVAKLLVVSGNTAIADPAAAPHLSDLPNGTLGIFNADTMTSIDPVTTNNAENGVRRLIFAVGRNTPGAANHDVNMSQVIQVDRVRSITARCYSPAVQKQLQISDLVSACGTQFGIKIVMSNAEIWQEYGFQVKPKYYTVKTNACTGCEDCPSDDGKDLVNKLYNAINDDPDGYFTAARISNADGTTVLTDGALWDNYDAVANGAPQLRITANAEAVAAASGINYMYFWPRAINFDVFPTEGFGENWTKTVNTNIAYEINSGYELRQLEYKLEGNDGNPGHFRITDSGVNLLTDHLVTDVAAEYITVVINYDNYAPSGLLEHNNPMALVIAIPCANTTASTDIANALDEIFDGMNFGGISDYVTACDCTSANTPGDPDANPATADLGDSGSDGGAFGTA